MATRDLAAPIYYVYALLDTRKPGRFKYGPWVFKFEPFYVGKGSGGRVHHHMRLRPSTKVSPKSNSLKSKKIRNIVKTTGEIPEHRIIKSNMLEQDAYNLERRVVQTIGRVQLKTGPLTNRSDGGEGQKNALKTPEMRAAQSKLKREWWASLTESDVQYIVDQNRKTRDNRTPTQRAAIKRKLSESQRQRAACETLEQKRARSEAYNKACQARTAEERAALSAKLSGSRKRFFDGLSDVQYLRFQAKLTDKRSQTWQSLTEEQREEIVERRRLGLLAHWDELTDEERLEHGSKISEGLQAMSERAKKRRKANISQALKEFNEENPDLVASRTKKTMATKSKWTEEERAEFGNRVASGHAARTPSEKARSARKMSESGKLRAQTESAAVKTQRAKALSKSNREAWASYTEEEREARTKVTAQARHEKPKKELKKINAKISDSVKASHASQTEEQRTARNAAISRSMRSKSPRDTQVYRAGCTMRARLRVVPRLYQDHKQKCKTWLASSTAGLDGSDKSWSKWNAKCSTFCDQLLSSVE